MKASVTGKKPKGSRNVQGKQAPVCNIVGNHKEGERCALLEGPKLAIWPIADLNSSFDDIDDEVFQQDSAEKEPEAVVVFRAPVRKITFNPSEDPINAVTNLMLPTAGGGSTYGPEWASFNEYRAKQDKAGGINSATDSDYHSVDFEHFKKKDVLISPKMDRSEGDMEMEGTNKRARPNPLEGANSISKLARIYDEKVKATRTAKGLGVAEDDNCEITRIGSSVFEPAPMPKPDYKSAPTLTLNELVPANFRVASHEPATSKMNKSFRSERIEFVLMARKLVATKQEDLDWELPSSEVYDQVVNEASAAFFDVDINHACLLYTSPSPRD